MHSRSIEIVDYTTKRYDLTSHIVGISIIIGFILPHTISSLLLFVNPLLVIVLKLRNKNKSYYKYKTVVLIALFIPLLLNFVQGVTFKSIQIWATICLYFFCFPFVDKVEFKNIYIYITFVFIFVSQMAGLLNISSLTNIINILYPMNDYNEGNLTYIAENITSENYTDFRLAGIYRNSNSCAEALCMLMGFYIANNRIINKYSIAFLGIMLYAILITGSRTGFMVAGAMVATYLILNKKKMLVILLGLLLILLFVFNGINSDLRVFEIQEGFSGSFSAKSGTFMSYLSSETSPIKLLFGYFDAARYRTMAKLGFMPAFDSDYGTLIFSYGFIGFFSILFFLVTVYRRVRKQERICFFLVLWMTSATIFKAFRMLFVFMLLLSMIYSNSRTSTNNDSLILTRH